MGSRKASMGRYTYLPPKGILIVTNLYWTTPRMEQKGEGKKSADNQSHPHAEWVEQCLKDFESLKPGMTRGEVDRKFHLDGGLQSASPVRYVHSECPSFKVNIEFDFKKDAADQNRAIIGKEDKVVRVSKPYLERPFMD